MTDLAEILPSFPSANFPSLLPTIEQHALTTTDLLALHPTDIAKQTHLPLLDLKRLIAAIQALLSSDLVPSDPFSSCSAPGKDAEDDACFISTLDSDLDRALGGRGVPTRYVTEFAGESGAGKTQFLLTLCLAVQLPPPRGLGKKALYISTESSLTTTRLAQMLSSNPAFSSPGEKEGEEDGAEKAEKQQQWRRPSLDNILSTATPDLESQDHILQFQVPVLLSRHSIGLIVLDSVAANYRAEFDRQGSSSRGSNMAARSAELVRLGAHLRNLARRHNLAVVVANQVADRFSSSSSSPYPRQHTRLSSPATARVSATPETPLASRSLAPKISLSGGGGGAPGSSLPFSLPDDYEDSSTLTAPLASPALLLDHQQRWFTGWGDDPHSSLALKTPSLGLVWTTQISCRVALFKRPVYGRVRSAPPPPVVIAGEFGDDDGGGEDRAPSLKTWRRWAKVVFSPYVEGSGQGLDGAVEFEITNRGLAAVKRIESKGKKREA